MDPITGAALISGGTQVLGMGAQAMGQASANQANLEAVHAMNAQNYLNQKDNQQWMEQMSNSAYQRSMADMKKAGLNPMLAFMKGGASTPQSTQVQAQAAKVDNVFGHASHSAAELGRTIMQTKQLDQELQKIEVQKGHLDVANRYVKIEEELKEPRQKQMEASTAESYSRSDLNKSYKQITEHEIPKAAAEGRFYKEYGDIYLKSRALIEAGRGAMDALNSAASIGRKRINPMEGIKIPDMPMPKSGNPSQSKQYRDFDKLNQQIEGQRGSPAD